MPEAVVHTMVTRPRRSSLATTASSRRQSRRSSKKNAVVRVAFDDTAIEGTMRWQYGKVVKVFTGGELVDINLDSGEELRATPTFDVDAVQ